MAHEEINQKRLEENHPELKNKNDMKITTHTPTELLQKPRSSAICTLCGNIVYRKKDSSRGEYVCEKCGYVMGEMMLVSKSGDEISLREEKEIMSGPRGIQIHKKEWKKLSNQAKHKKIWGLERKYNPKRDNMTDFRYKTQYIPFLKVVSGIYKMTSRQEQYVLDILNYLQGHEKRGLQRLCNNCSYKMIILALCLHSQGQDSRLINLDKDEFCKELKLTYPRYNRIRDHISAVDRDASEYYRNHPQMDDVENYTENYSNKTPI